MIKRAIRSLLRGILRSTPAGAGSPGTSVSGLRYDGTPLWDMELTPAMGISTVCRCVSVLSDSIASLPVHYMRRNGGVFKAEEGSRLQYLLNVEPDAWCSGFDFWKQLVVEVLMAGNAYVVPVWSAETGDWLRLALCGRGTVIHDTTTDTYIVSDRERGVAGVYDESGIIHVKGMPGRDPKRGVSVLTHARRSMQIAGTGDRETQSRFENGGDVRGIIGNDTTLRGMGEYQDRELENLAEKTDRLFRQGERIVSLPGQVSWQQLSMSSADMQFLESRRFTVTELCRFFGVHPSMVFEDTSSNYKSAEMANVAFLSNTLNPWLRKIEGEFRRKLFPPSLSWKRKIEFDRSGLYACDLNSKVRYQTALIGAGLRTVNELRREENRPDVAGGDTVFVSANLRNIREDCAGTARGGE